MLYPVKKIFLLIIVFGWVAISASKAQINTEVENFTLQNLLDSTSFDLETDCKDDEAVVLIIISTYCPFAESYKDRIKQFHTDYEDKKVRFVLINPENPQDSEEAMLENAKEFDLPYLLDTGQVVTKKLEAVKTPEVFVLQKSLGHFILKYHGAIDDNPQIADEVEAFYLKDALDAILEKSSPTNDYEKPTGCMIKN